MKDESLTSDGTAFREQLYAARLHREMREEENKRQPRLQVAGVGQTISAAYEQLRIAAENTEEHLLLQRAIRRFYTRNISFHVRKAPSKLGEELIVELTQAGYIKNNSIPLSTPEKIDEIIKREHDVFWRLRDKKIAHKLAANWSLDILSVETEELLGGDHSANNVLVHFATQHFREMLKSEPIAKQPSFELSLYVATHRALLRSDLANVRRTVLQLYGQTAEDIATYQHFNETIDTVFLSENTAKLQRFASKYGAPWRVLKGLLNDSAALDELLPHKDKFLSAYETQIKKEYEYTSRRMTRGVVKSVIFLFITKVIIGLAIEIPYDMMIHGMVAWIPLAINILFPPFYMASLRLSLKMPGDANVEATKQYAEQLLYGSGVMPKHVVRFEKRTSTASNFFYGMMFVISFSLVIAILATLGFNIVQGIIFFLFISTASFLGFRLSRLVREYEMFTTRQNFFEALRDFIYTPFVVVGRWLSDKYSRVNIVTLILDMAIELPLKTFLRLVRQWTRFLNEKRDEI